MVYVVLFPQLLLVIHASNYTNTYGCIAGFLTGFIARGLSINKAILYQQISLN